MRRKKSPAASPPPIAPASGVPFNRWYAVFFYAAFFCLGAVLTLLARQWWVPPPAKTPLPPPPQAPPALAAAPLPPATPWGQLQVTDLNLQYPESLLPTNDVPPAPLTWFFEGRDRQQVVELLAQSSLAPPLQQQLMAQSPCEISPEGTLLRPPTNLVCELPPPARIAIYKELRKTLRNPYHYSPFRFDAAKFGSWLAQSGLDAGHQALFRQLCYTINEVVYFSDCPIIESVCTLAEKQALNKSISETPTLLMQLKVGPDSDREALARYWAQYENGRLMKPLLDSLGKVPGGSYANVSFFLPPLPRQRLYTFPDPARSNQRTDCFWSAMNFFNDPPDDRFSDWKYTVEVLRQEYYQAPTNWIYGDLILLVNQGSIAIHMCVYIADQVVFTKNGVDIHQPWVLMRLADMLRCYDLDQPFRVVAYRRKF